MFHLIFMEDISNMVDIIPFKTKSIEVYLYLMIFCNI